MIRFQTKRIWQHAAVWSAGRSDPAGLARGRRTAFDRDWRRWFPVGGVLASPDREEPPGPGAAG